MKKTVFAALTALAVMASSCMSGLTGATSSSTGNVLGSVLGSVLGNVLFGGMGLTQSSLVGNWNYSAPNAAFTTEQAFAAAGGSTATANLESSLAPNYQAMGITKKNTSFNFEANNRYSAQVGGIPFNGTYTYNEQNGGIVLKTGSKSISGNVVKTSNGIALMFDANQMAALLQNVGNVSNKTAVAAVSNLAKSADGARVGFQLTK